MKKMLSFLIPILAIASCSIELDTNDSVVEGDSVVVNAAIDNSETKTDYAFDNEGNPTSAIFCWSGTEQIGRLTWTNAMDHTIYTSTTSANSGQTELSFQGDPVSGDTGFAVYPRKGARAGFDWYSNPFSLYLGEAIDYDKDHPLKGIVPMLGKLEAGKYVFKPVTGVIGIRMAHIPATANKITISSTTTKLSQGFRYTAESETVNYSDELDDIYEYGLLLSSARDDAKNTKSYTFTAGSLDFDAVYTFYYPIPVGKITGGLTVTLYHDSSEIISKSSNVDIEVKRATITRLPLITLPTEIETWTSISTGKFIDTFVWSDQSLGSDPVEVEFFQSSIEGRYRIANPYAAAGEVAGKTVTGADNYLYFTLGDKGRVTYEWVNMGLPLSKNSAKNWAMLDGYSVAGYGDGYARSHVVSYNSDGTPANVQLAPCYRTVDENKTGNPSDYDNEIGKDSLNGIIEIAFPGKEILMPYTIAGEKISVSSNSGDSAGAAGLIDDNLANCWHTPWGSASTGYDHMYGEYVQIQLTEGLSKFAFNYCTRNTAAQGGAPKKIIIGGSKNSVTWTKLAEYELGYMNSTSPNTWIGLPVITNASDYAYLRFGVVTNQNGHDLTKVSSSSQWCNLAELKIYGSTTGASAPAESAPTAEQVTLTDEMISVNVDAGDDLGNHYDGQGKAALVDSDVNTFWHTPYYTKSTFEYYHDPDHGGYWSNVTGTPYGSDDLDPTYGAFIDIALTQPVQYFHLAYNVRYNNNNGEPREIKFAGSKDGSSWTLITTIVNDNLMKKSAGSLVTLPIVCAETAYSYLRIGITKAGNNDANAITPTASNSTALGEIYLYKY